MKYLLSTLVALGCMSANATKIIQAKSAQDAKKIAAKLMAAGDVYSGALAVGRMSVISWQVELVGLTITDQNSGPDPVTPPVVPYALRKVKAVLDISPTAYGDMDDSNAMMRAEHFFNTKLGFKDDCGSSCGGGGGGPFTLTSTIPVAKVTSVIFDPLTADVTIGTVGCMGADIEILDLGTALTTDKLCYKVKPKYIIEHAL